MKSFLVVVPAACLALFGCSTVDIDKADAVMVIGNVWKNAPWRGFGGISVVVHPYDPATGAAGGSKVSTNHFGFDQLFQRSSGAEAAYDVRRVVSGYYVIGHYELIAGSNEIKFICPPIGIEVRPGQVAYVGDITFDRFEYEGLTRDTQRAERLLAGNAEVAGRLSGATLIQATLDYSNYRNPGLIAGVPENPCGATAVQE